MIRNVLSLKVHAETTSVFLRALSTLIRSARSRAGCVDCYLGENFLNPGQICLSTTWSDRNEFEQFARSPSYGRILAMIDKATRTPQVSVETISDVGGMEYLAKVRCCLEPVEGD